MEPLKKPSRTVQALCPYWLMWRDGSSANAPSQHASTIPRRIAALRADGRRVLGASMGMHITAFFPGGTNPIEVCDNPTLEGGARVAFGAIVQPRRKPTLLSEDAC